MQIVALMPSIRKLLENKYFQTKKLKGDPFKCPYLLLTYFKR